MKTSAQYLSRITAAVIGSCMAFVAPSLLAQTTAVTDPVGFITLNVAGTGGAGGSSLSFRGLGLTRPVEYQGSAESVTATSLTDNDATWVDNQFNGPNGSYFLEITSGPGAGTTYDITATTAANKTVALGQNLATGVVAPVTFKIRKHWTIAAVFGPANEAGLQGGTSTSADQLLLWNGTGYDIFYYQTSGLGGTGWRQAGAPSVDAGGTKLVMEELLLLKRGQATAVNVILMGAVKIGQTSVPVFGGNNFLGNVYAAPMSLQSSGIYTGNPATGLAGGSSVTADQILLWNGTGYDIYYFQTSGLGGTGWRRAGAPSTDASATALPVGSGFIVKRTNAGNFNWVIPQHPATL